MTVFWPIFANKGELPVFGRKCQKYGKNQPKTAIFCSFFGQIQPILQIRGEGGHFGRKIPKFSQKQAKIGKIWPKSLKNRFNSLKNMCQNQPNLAKFSQKRLKLKLLSKNWPILSQFFVKQGQIQPKISLISQLMVTLAPNGAKFQPLWGWNANQNKIKNTENHRSVKIPQNG